MPQARLIRRPVYIRGAKSIVGAKNLTTGRFCRFDLDGTKPTLFIGDNCEMGDMTHVVALANVKIGNNVLIASKCFISDTNHGYYAGVDASSPDTPPKDRALFSDKVIIGNNVWIGENAVLLSGTEIGDGCVVGANSVISKKIPANCIVVLNGIILKKYDEAEQTWNMPENKQ